MARQIRIEYPGAIYHVMARGNRREAIVLDETDREGYEKLWGEAVERTGWRMLAWVLMENHYHALIMTPEANLVEGMKWVQNTWTRRFNRRHKSWGRLFGDRYKSILCDDGVYLQALINYIHLNPVRASMIAKEQSLERYRWSSLLDYSLPARKRRCWVDVCGGLSALGYEDTAAGRRKYLQSLNNLIDWSKPRQAGKVIIENQTLHSTLSRGWYFGTETFREKALEWMKESLGGKRREAASGYSGQDLKDHDETAARLRIEHCLRELGLDRKDLETMKKGDERKIAIAALLRQTTTVDLKWISRELNMGATTRISAGVNRLAKGPPRDRKLLDRMRKSCEEM